MAQRLGPSYSSQNLRASAAYPPRRLPHSASSVSLLLPQSASYHSFGHGSRVRSSGTWTTSSGELGLLSNADEVDDRDVFVQEYNRLAKKHGVRQLVSEDFDAHQRGDVVRASEKRSWISRILRSSPSRYPHNSPTSLPPLRQVRHKRSVSEFAHIIRCRRDAPKIIDIQDMVRLSGKSMLYLPQEYSPCSLILPTCIRATAQYLAQNVATRGLFRVPGSSKVISALFDYYCFENGNPSISSTVRCASLPVHIQYSVHDVASTFKRLLSVLPGGILGSLDLLDAFIAIHSQLNGEPEYPRTKQTKVRARLIALAIGTIKSQYRREMICAVFGLLSLIGRVAEVAPREDEDSRPLPTADLMGYSALGIVFGPLLVGDLLDQYTMKVVTPSSGMLVFPLSPPRFRKDRRRSTQIDAKTAGSPTVDKILVANNMTEMLIANWRDVVRQMKSLGTHYRKDTSTVELAGKIEQPSSPQGFDLRGLKNLDEGKDEITELKDGRPRQDPETPTPGHRKRRLKALRRATSQRLMPKMSIATLSPTKEESFGDDGSSDDNETDQKRETVLERLHKAEQNRRLGEAKSVDISDNISQKTVENEPPCSTQSINEVHNIASNDQTCQVVAQVYLESVPPRESSKKISSHDGTDGSFSRPASQAGENSPGRLNDPRSDSSLSETTPTNDKHSLITGVQAEITKPAFGCMSPVSTLFVASQVMPKGGIRVVEGSPAQPGNPNDALQRSMQPGLRTSHTYQDQGIQCDMFPNEERRHSIDVTPERFYSFKDGPEIELGEHVTSEQQHRHQQKQATVLHQPRLSRSYEHFRSQTAITVQSPTDSTESKDLTKHGSVKAMAAMFETQTGGQTSPSFAEDPIAARNEQKMRSRDRHSKSDSAWTHRNSDSFHDPPQGKSGGVTSTASGLELHQIGMGMPNDRHQRLSLDSDNDGSLQEPTTNYSPSLLLGSEVNEAALKAVPSLGTMIPCREQPPVAHHLNLARPLSSPSPVQVLEPYHILDVVSTTQASRPRSATVLYSQLRNLQRQLNAKTEEAAQLRRQLEAQKDSDVGTVSEQLRQAKRDVATWKNRAETAERRVQVLDKFTEKLKQIRDAIADSRFHRLGDEGGNHHEKPGSANPGLEKAIETLKMVQEQDGSGNRDKEDGPSGAAAKRERSLHGLSATQDGTLDSSSTTKDDGSREDGCNCLATRMRKSSEQIWAVAEELLQMQEDGCV